jgi:uncharacterized membrane protein YeaQ/YmgE (transglycosylase-associated protein family)
VQTYSFTKHNSQYSCKFDDLATMCAAEPKQTFGFCSQEGIGPLTTPPISIPSITIPAIVITLLVAALCGAVAQLVVGYTRGGCLASILIGLVGALLGNWLAGVLHMPNLILLAGVDVVWTFIGAAILVAGLALTMGGPRLGGYFRRDAEGDEGEP